MGTNQIGSEGGADLGAGEYSGVIMSKTGRFFAGLAMNGGMAE